MFVQILLLFVAIGSYFLDIGLDVLVAKEQSATLFLRYDLQSKVCKVVFMSCVCIYSLWTFRYL